MVRGSREAKSVHPYIYYSEHFSIPTYGALYLVAFLATIFMIGHLGNRLGAPFWRMIDFAFMIAIAGEVGARITYVIVEWPRFVNGTISLKEFLLAGRVVLGGILAGLACAFWLGRRFRLPATALLDVVLASAPLGMGIGRIACLMAGCCYGKPTDLWWGITFTDPMARALNGTPLGVPLHPTQILQALDGFLLFGLMYWIFGRRRFDGQIVALYFLLEGASRFLVEFLRGDPRGAAMGLATSQWVGMVMAVAGLLWLAFGSRGGLTPARGGFHSP